MTQGLGRDPGGIKGRVTCVCLGEEQEAIRTPRKLVGKESSLEEETFELEPEGLMRVRQEGV